MDGFSRAVDAKLGVKTQNDNIVMGYKDDGSTQKSRQHGSQLAGASAFAG